MGASGDRFGWWGPKMLQLTPLPFQQGGRAERPPSLPGLPGEHLPTLQGLSLEEARTPGTRARAVSVETCAHAPDPPASEVWGRWESLAHPASETSRHTFLQQPESLCKHFPFTPPPDLLTGCSCPLPLADPSAWPALPHFCKSSAPRSQAKALLDPKKGANVGSRPCLACHDGLTIKPKG